MSLTQVAVLILGALVIIESQSSVSSTFKLIVGILAVALVLLDVVLVYRRRDPRVGP